MINTHLDTGIPFGIISANRMDQEVVQELMYEHGTNVDYKHHRDEHIEEVMSTQFASVYDNMEDEDYESMLNELDPDWEESFQYEACEPHIEGTYEGVSYSTCWLGGALSFVIYESPITTHKAKRGSPCVPNMGVLDTLDGDYLCFDVPSDWRYEDAEESIH